MGKTGTQNSSKYVFFFAETTATGRYAYVSVLGVGRVGWVIWWALVARVRTPFRSTSEGAILEEGEQGRNRGVPLLHLGQILGVCASSWLILWDIPPADTHPRQHTVSTHSISGGGSETTRTDDGKANCRGGTSDASQMCVTSGRTHRNPSGGSVVCW